VLLRQLTPGRLLGAGLALLLAVLLVLWLAPSSDYLFLPDTAHPVAPLISAPGRKLAKQSDGFYYVDVRVKKATLLEQLFPGIHDGSTLVPGSVYNPSGESESQQVREGRQMMRQSQSVAAAVALQALGYKNLIHPQGVLVLDVASDVPAARVLRPGDVILGVNGRPVRTSGVCGGSDSLRGALRGTKPGTTVTLRVHRDGKLLNLPVRTVRAGGRAIIGIDPQTLARVSKLPVPVRIDAGDVGGPSAGLAFSLALLDELGRDVDHGRRVAVTGTIEPDGCVGPIGGVKQKTLGARAAGVDAFLVPAGDNAREARRYAGGLKVVPVHNFRQALQALATLPGAAQKA
jgi:Lon-like protease